MTGVRCMLMRGGTSKGAYFLAGDLPSGPAERDGLLLRIMGTPDPRQVDGIGGAHPLTSKVAVVSPSEDPDAQYAGNTAISGVPGTAARIELDFAGTEGSSCGALLPTGRPRDLIDGIEVTCVDNGMPVVVAAASDFGVTGYESDLSHLRDRVQSLRLQAGELMGLGDVSAASVPKTTLVAPPRDGGMI